MRFEALEKRDLLTSFISPVAAESNTASLVVGSSIYGPDSVVSDVGFAGRVTANSQLGYRGNGNDVAWITIEPVSTLKLTLPHAADVSEVVIWNSIWADTSRSAKDITLEFYRNGKLLSIQSFEVQKGSAYSVKPENIDVIDVRSVDSIHLTIASNYGNAKWSSISKLRVIGSESPPELPPYSASDVNALQLAGQGVSFYRDDLVHLGAGTVTSDPNYGDVILFDPNTGRLIRDFPFESVYDAAAKIYPHSNGRLIVVARELGDSRDVNRTSAYYADTGELAWQTPRNSMPGALHLDWSTYDDDGTTLLYLSTDMGTWIINGDDGSYTKISSLYSSQAPAVDQENGVVYLAERAKVTKRDAVTGAILGSASVPHPYYAPTTGVTRLENGVVIAKYTKANSWSSVNAGRLIAFDSDLNELWRFDEVPTGKKHTHTTFNGLVVWGVGNHGPIDPHQAAGIDYEYLTAVDVQTGEIVWQTEKLEFLDGAIFNLDFDEENNRIIGDTQYSTQGVDEVFALDASNGDLLDVVSLGSVETSCAIARWHGGYWWTGSVLNGDKLLKVSI